jgi:hypothetical protein
MVRVLYMHCTTTNKFVVKIIIIHTEKIFENICINFPQEKYVATTRAFSIVVQAVMNRS